jgi:hypothetical protein
MRPVMEHGLLRYSWRFDVCGHGISRAWVRKGLRIRAAANAEAQAMTCEEGVSNTTEVKDQLNQGARCVRLFLDLWALARA